MEPIFFLIGMALVAWLNYYLAEQRGRSTVGWAIGGALFGVLSTILLLVIGTTEEKRMADAVKLHNAINK